MTTRPPWIQAQESGYARIQQPLFLPEECQSRVFVSKHSFDLVYLPTLFIAGSVIFTTIFFIIYCFKKRQRGLSLLPYTLLPTYLQGRNLESESTDVLALSPAREVDVAGIGMDEEPDLPLAETSNDQSSRAPVDDTLSPALWPEAPPSYVRKPLPTPPGSDSVLRRQEVIAQEDVIALQGDGRTRPQDVTTRDSEWGLPPPYTFE